MPHVFVSYAHDLNEDFVSSVREQIRRAGHPLWSDIDLVGGDEWEARIDDAIRGAFAVVLVWSPTAMRSKYVNYEWAFALGSRVAVITLMRGTTPTDLPAPLERYQALDFSNDEHRPWGALDKALRSALDSAERAKPSLVPAVQAAARALQSVVASEREAALDSLAEMTDDASLDVLAEATAHASRDVRRRAGVALCRRGDKRGIDAIVEELCAPDSPGSWEVTDECAGALDHLRSDAAPALVKLCQHPHPRVRASVADALGAVHDESTIGALAAVATDDDESVRTAATEALGSFAAGPAVLESLGRSAQDKAPNVRRAAARALGEIGGRSVFAVLAKMVSDPNENVSGAAVIALGRTDHPDAVPILVDQLKSDDEDARLAALRALKQLGSPAAVPALLAHLDEPGSFDLRGAFEALDKIGGDDVIRGWIQALTHSNAEVARMAAAALARKEARESIPALIALLERSVESRAPAADTSLVSTVIEALGALRAADAVPKLIRCLDVADDRVQRATATALERIGTSEARDALVKRRRQARTES